LRFICDRGWIDFVYPPKLRFENKKRKFFKVHFKIFLSFLFIRDRGWIQTSNLLSRNQVRYSVAPRGLFL
jgi:hypothetical protein